MRRSPAGSGVDKVSRPAMRRETHLTAIVLSEATMCNTLRPCILGFVASSACALWAPLAAQSQANRGTEPGAPDVCGLVSHDEVKKLSEDPMVKFWTEPEVVQVTSGSGCQYSGGIIYLFSGSKSEANWNAFLKSWNQDAQPRTPLSGIGDRAYLMYEKPRNKYAGRHAVVVAAVGQQTVAVALEANGEEPVEKVRPRVEALAKLVVSKLR